MKNLVYVSAIELMGLIACGAPAEKNDTNSQETTEAEVSTEVVEMDSTASEMDSTKSEEVAE